jgi:two-component system chemotaxis response regulator CheY
MSTDGKKVLIVEDDENLRSILKKMCEDESWTVFEAEDGLKAVEQSSKHKPHIVLLDLLMPKLDGFGYLKEIRKHSDAEISKVPVIVLSNLWSNKDILLAESLTIAAYFVKTNVTLEEVVKKVHEIIDK